MPRRTKKQAQRLLKVSGLSLKVGSSFLRQRVREFFTEPLDVGPQRLQMHVRNAERIAETIGQMKGTIMKFGQMLSVNREFLPPEVTRVLSTLQKEAPPVDFAVIEGQVRTELGGTLKQRFTRFEEKPLAAASIGQVHRASLPGGREVVVKVQYPGVDEDVEGDLRNLKILFLSLKAIKPGLDLSHIMKELRELMLEELDYRREAKHVGIFRRCFGRDVSLAIPEVVKSHTTRRVLTLEYLPGTPLEEYCESESSGTQRNRVGEQLMRFYLKQLFVHHVLHGDPNPGNFAIAEDGKLIVYDFGCVKFFPKSFIHAYRRLIRDFLDGRRQRYRQDFERLGFRQIDTKDYPPEFFERYGLILMAPFLREPYSFANADLQERTVQTAKMEVSDLFNFRPPRHVVFHDRVLVGAYNHLRALRATGYWRTLLEDVFKMSEQPASEM